MTPLDLLRNVVAVADVALGDDARVSVPETTLRELLAQVREASRAGEPPRLIQDDTVMLVQALHLMAIERDAADTARAKRYGYIAQALLAWLRTDFAKAVVEAETEARRERAI